MVILMALILLPSIVQAKYSDYTSSLQSIGVPSTLIDDNKPLYRNDVIRLLSTISCIDCLHPNQYLTDKYSSSRWRSFIKQPGNNFDDILRNNYFWNGENYYYCAALSAEQGVINGYPRDISPFCPGKFCGANLVKQGEMIQIIYNLKRQQLSKTYQADRASIKSRLSKQNPTSAAFKNFTLVDLTNINAGILKCNNQQKCDISSALELDTYAKFCTWNLSACEMVSLRNLGQGQRPVAEINILMKEGVMSIVEADQIKPYDLATNQQLLNYLYRLNQSVNCSFDLDYDKDGITNHQDNCPVTYNPSQLNTDNDDHGDVCDEDIDWDGLLNPQYLVNDIGFVNPKYYQSTVPSPIIALAIQHEAVIYKSLATTFTALYSGIVNSLDWDFGDKQTGQGISVSHSYSTTGQKVVTVIANNILSSSARINVLDATSMSVLKTLSISADKLLAQTNESIQFTALTTGGVKSVRWDFNDGKTNTGFQVKHSFQNPGIYTVYAIGDDDLIARIVVNISHNQNIKKDPNLKIECVPTSSSSIETLKCTATTSWVIKTIEWTFCDGSTGAGKQITRKLSKSIDSCLVTALWDKKYADQTIVYDKKWQKYDNCPTRYNVNQGDSNKNGLGDECEKASTGGNGLVIQTTADKLTAPAKVSLKAISSGYTCQTWNTRNLGNNQVSNNINANTTYTKGWTYEIGLVDCRNNTAFTTITIADTGDSKVGLQIVPNPLSWPEGFTAKVTPKVQGTCDTISRTIDSNTKPIQTTNKTQTASLQINWKGKHSINAYCYVGNQIKALAQANVAIQPWASSYLEADDLTPTIWQPVKLKTLIQGFDTKQVQSVSRDFGDATNLGGKSLNTIHIYLKAGIAIVRETITLTDGQVLTNIIQLNVVDKQADNWFMANLIVSPLVGTTKDSFFFQLIPNNPKTIKSLSRHFGDGQTKQASADGLKQLHTYSKAGTYLVAVVATLLDGSQPSYGWQVTVTSVDPCLGLIKSDWTNQTYQCDMDNDGTPDMCDDDIEGDGYINPVGLLLFEKDDCSIWDNLNMPLLEQYGNQSNNDPSLDNCPLTSNAGQENTDSDQYGNVCDTDPSIPNTNNNNDNDNDGIPNHLDILPNVPNGSLGLPNTLSPLVVGTNSTIANTCVACPCGFTQTLSPLAQGDMVYAEMWYEGGTIKSNFFPIK